VQALPALARDWSTVRVCEELYEPGDGECLEDSTRVFARLLCFSMSVPFSYSHLLIDVFSAYLLYPSSHAAPPSRCSYYNPIHISLAVASSPSHIRAQAPLFPLVLVTFPPALVKCTIT
jgi:hypothetical protein